MNSRLYRNAVTIVLVLGMQGCWAGSGEVSKDFALENDDSVEAKKNDSTSNQDHYDVCDFILDKKRESTLKSIFEKTKPLKPGAFMFDISQYVKSGGGKVVIAESVQGTKYNFYMTLSQVKLKENGLLDNSTKLSDHRLEFKNSALFFFYKNSPYLLTKLSDLESDIRKNVYKLSNSKFELACK